MTTKVKLIGSSHAGAMKYGWEQINSQHGNIDLSYVVAPRDVLGLLTVTKDAVFGVASDSGLTTAQIKAIKARSGDIRFDLRRNDVVLLIGTNPEPAFLRQLLQTTDVDDLRDTGAPSRLSQPALNAILDDYVARILPSTNWHGWDTPQVIYVETPRRSELVLETAHLGQNENPAGYAAVFDLLSDRLGDALQKVGIRYVPQPRDTIAENGLTKATYSTDSTRFFSEQSHSEQDTIHMNGDYGMRVWRDILDCIATKTQ